MQGKMLSDSLIAQARTTRIINFSRDGLEVD